MVGNLSERNHFEDLDVDGRIILIRMLMKQGGSVGVRGLGLIWLRMEAFGGFL
jgi:hypothetical protein